MLRALQKPSALFARIIRLICRCQTSNRSPAAAASRLRLGSPLVYKSSGMIWQLAPSILVLIQSYVLRVQGLHGRIMPVRRLVDRLDLGAHVRQTFRQTGEVA